MLPLGVLGEELLRQVGDSNGNEEVQDHDQISEGEPLTSIGVVSVFIVARFNISGELEDGIVLQDRLPGENSE